MTIIVRGLALGRFRFLTALTEHGVVGIKIPGPYDTDVDLDGYVRGVKWNCLCPGATLPLESEATPRWSKALGIDFHEVRIETDAHDRPDRIRPLRHGVEIRVRVISTTGVSPGRSSCHRSERAESCGA